MVAVISFDHIDVFWEFESFGTHVAAECTNFGVDINNASQLFECQPQMDPRHVLSFNLPLEPSGYYMRTIDGHHWLDRQEIASI
jgi:hypothetical protein